MNISLGNGVVVRLDADADLIALFKAGQQRTPEEREAAARAVLARLPVVATNQARQAA